MPTRREEKAEPLERGPLYGAAYCVAGVCVGIGAARIHGGWSVPIWILAALLFAAGVWTAAFTGWLLIVLRRAERQSGR